MSVQDDFLKLVKDNKYIFKEITDKAGESEKSVHNMFKRRSVRCDVLEKLLAVIGKELQIVDKKDEWKKYTLWVIQNSQSVYIFLYAIILLIRRKEWLLAWVV